jgi:hypothetical protein
MGFSISLSDIDWTSKGFSISLSDIEWASKGLSSSIGDMGTCPPRHSLGEAQSIPQTLRPSEIESSSEPYKKKVSSVNAVSSFPHC